MPITINPNIPAGRQVIEGYRGGGFRISGVRHEGSVFVLPDRTLPWPVREIGEITVADLDPSASAGPGVDVILLGSGDRMRMLPGPVRAGLREAGLNVDVMETGAACRTYNILLAEERRVAAALIAI